MRALSLIWHFQNKLLHGYFHLFVIAILSSTAKHYYPEQMYLVSRKDHYHFLSRDIEMTWIRFCYLSSSNIVWLNNFCYSICYENRSSCIILLTFILLQKVSAHIFKTNIKTDHHTLTFFLIPDLIVEINQTKNKTRDDTKGNDTEDRRLLSLI